MGLTSRQHLEAGKPKAEDFEDPEAFEEALGYWMGHAGRILALSRSPQALPKADSSGT